MQQQQRHAFEHAADDSLVRAELLDDARVEFCGRRGHRAPGDRQRRRKSWAVYESRVSSRPAAGRSVVQRRASTSRVSGTIVTCPFLGGPSPKRATAATDTACHGEGMAARIELTLRPRADVKPLDIRTAQRI